MSFASNNPDMIRSSSSGDVGGNKVKNKGGLFTKEFCRKMFSDLRSEENILSGSSSSGNVNEGEKNERNRRNDGVVDVKRTEVIEIDDDEDSDEDFAILESDPTTDFEHKLSLSDQNPSILKDEDVSVVSERGHVACRDYPHSRHNCAKYPFGKTAPESCCSQCYCYVCDEIAPCKFWDGESGHCNASDGESKWQMMRMIMREAVGRESISDELCFRPGLDWPLYPEDGTMQKWVFRDNKYYF